MARLLGKGVKEFKEGINDDDTVDVAADEDEDEPVSSRVHELPPADLPPHRGARARRGRRARRGARGGPTRPLRTPPRHRTVIGIITRLARVRRLDHGEEATLVEHLTELRDRLIACVIVLAVAFAVAFWRYHDLFSILNAQLPQELKDTKPITTEIGEAFTLTIMISLYTALLVTFPFTLYQLYSYLIPAFSPDAARS